MIKVASENALWLEAIDTMQSSYIRYLQVIFWERLPIRSMYLFKIFSYFSLTVHQNEWMLESIFNSTYKYPSEFWLGFLLFCQKMSFKNWKGRVLRIWKWYLPVCISPSFSVKIPTSWFLCQSRDILMILNDCSLLKTVETLFYLAKYFSWYLA